MKISATGNIYKIKRENGEYKIMSNETLLSTHKSLREAEATVRKYYKGDEEARELK